MIANVSWSSLQQSRTEARLVMIYRITHDILACRTDVYRHSFFPAGIRLRNQLPEHDATTQTLESFKAVGIFQGWPSRPLLASYRDA